MRWFAMEVWEERQWRKQIAKQLAQEAQQYLAIRHFGRKNMGIRKRRRLSQMIQISHFHLQLPNFSLLFVR